MRLPPLSIRVKLPLLIGALVLAVAASFSLSAYRGVSQASLVTASDRLGSVTTQIASLLETSATQLLTNARAVADSPAIRAFLQSPTPRARAAALAAMRPVGPAAQQIADVELVTTGGARLLSLSDSAAPPARAGVPAASPEMVQTGSRSDSGVIRPFEVVGDSVRYAVVAPTGCRAGADLFPTRSSAIPRLQAWRRGTLGTVVLRTLSGAPNGPRTPKRAQPVSRCSPGLPCRPMSR